MLPANTMRSILTAMLIPLTVASAANANETTIQRGTKLTVVLVASDDTLNVPNGSREN